MSVRGANSTSGVVRLLLSKVVLPGITILKAPRRTDPTPKDIFIMHLADCYLVCRPRDIKKVAVGQINLC